MQPTAKDTKQDAARPEQSNMPNQSTEERGEHDRLKRTADKMAGRGLKRQQKGERGKIISK